MVGSEQFNETLLSKSSLDFDYPSVLPLEFILHDTAAALSEECNSGDSPLQTSSRSHCFSCWHASGATNASQHRRHLNQPLERLSHKSDSYIVSNAPE